jgi:hypothetical protein
MLFTTTNKRSVAVNTHAQAQTPAQVLTNAAAAIKSASYAQRDTEPHHVDFGALAYAIEHVLDAGYAINVNLGAQVAHYEQGRRLRTDIDHSPAEVLAEALDHGGELQQALDQARRAAHRTGQQFDRLAFQPEPDVDTAGA